MSLGGLLGIRAEIGERSCRCIAIHGLRIHQWRFTAFWAVNRCGSVA